MKREIRGRGVPLPTVVTIVFVALKLTGVIDWSWLLVISPNLIVMAIMIVIMIAKK